MERGGVVIGEAKVLSRVTCCGEEVLSGERSGEVGPVK